MNCDTKSKTCPSCNGKVCSGHGTCSLSVCTCSNGWGGESCSISNVFSPGKGVGVKKGTPLAKRNFVFKPKAGAKAPNPKSKTNVSPRVTSKNAENSPETDGFCGPDYSMRKKGDCLAGGICNVKVLKGAGDGEGEFVSIMDRKECESSKTKAGDPGTWHSFNFWFFPRNPLDAMIREICEEDDPDRMDRLLDIWEKKLMGPLM
jgi:hypothetical protein